MKERFLGDDEIIERVVVRLLVLYIPLIYIAIRSTITHRHSAGQYTSQSADGISAYVPHPFLQASPSPSFLFLAPLLAIPTPRCPSHVVQTRPLISYYHLAPRKYPRTACQRYTLIPQRPPPAPS